MKVQLLFSLYEILAITTVMHAAIGVHVRTEEKETARA